MSSDRLGKNLQWLFGLNIALFLLAQVFALLLEGERLDDTVFNLLGGFNARAILRDWYVWQLVVSNFAHIEIYHFFINMFALYQIGPIVRQLYSGKKLFITYILGGIGAGVLSLFAYLLLGQSAYSVGASGSIMALLGLLIGGKLRNDRYGADLPLDIGQLLMPVVLTLAVGFMPGLRVNNAAHIGGLVVGILVGYFISNSLVSSVESKEVDLVYKVSLGITILSFAAYVLYGINALLL